MKSQYHKTHANLIKDMTQSDWYIQRQKEQKAKFKPEPCAICKKTILVYEDGNRLGSCEEDSKPYHQSCLSGFISARMTVFDQQEETLT